MRLLLTGAAGMLGQDVGRSAAAHEVIPLAHDELDIADRAAVGAAVAQAAPDTVINCAAWTDVDQAERSPDKALAVNGVGAENVARAASAAGAHVIHVSSDYVFDGSQREPYVESDLPRPISAYGRSKLAGEEAVAAAAPDRHTIVRSAWLFGIGGRSFPATIMRLARERDELRVVDDQVGSPTFTGHLAAALTRLAEHPLPGVVHVAGAGRCSWYEFAREIVAEAGITCSVHRATTAEMARPAPRPAFSVLESERPQAPRLPHWRAGLREFLALAVPTR